MSGVLGDIMLLLIVQLLSLYSVISAKQRALVEKVYGKTLLLLKHYYSHNDIQVKS